PRLAQQAAVLGVLAEGGRPQLDLHAVYLELTSQSAPGLNAARRVRGVYRVPVGRTSGTECLSGTTYRPLQWQHLIAQRRGDQFEIYLNGEVATSGPVDVTNALPRGRLLLGALYAARDGSSCAGRPFAGVVDEVAVYDHPLSASDVLRHYRMGPHRK
ncbi:LamG domain-containing protein, partial [bacterium]|nr:LamG domain-containing protein [bacterium]